MTMTFDDTIRFYATAAEDDHDFADEADEDDLRHRFDEDEEEEEVTLSSDDDEEEDDELTRPDTHAEEASVFSMPPSPVTGYTPPTREPTLPVSNEAAAKPVVKKAAPKKAAA